MSPKLIKTLEAMARPLPRPKTGQAAMRRDAKSRRPKSRAATSRSRKKSPEAIARAQREWQARETAERKQMRRWQCTLFLFWSVCTNKACRRARACAGEPEACFARWWPHVPQEVKVRYRAMVKTSDRSPAEIGRAGAEAVARYRRAKEEDEAAARDGRFESPAPQTSVPQASVPQASMPPVPAPQAPARPERPLARVRII